MTARLGELLMQAKIINLDEMDQVLQNQVVFGGRFGTNLIEMGFMTEEELTGFLAKTIRVPAADPELVKNLPEETIRLVPREVAEKFKIVPIALERRRLTVAAMDPHDLESMDALAFTTGYTILPAVSTEFRLVLALEKYYGIRRKLRHPSLSGVSPKQVKRRRSPGQESHDLLTAPNYFAPQTKEELAPLKEEFHGFDQYPDDFGPDGASHLTLDNVAERLANAADRDAIAEAIINYTSQWFPCSALFLIRGTSAIGWKGLRDGNELAGFDELDVPLDTPSVLQYVMENKQFFLGPVTDSPVNDRLVAGLGGVRPESSLILPIMLLKRTVALLYLDGPSDRLTPRLLELQRLLGKTALAFEILLLRNKILSA
jgi:hypothetical protein